MAYKINFILLMFASLMSFRLVQGRMLSRTAICDGPEQYSVCCGPLKEEIQVGNCKNRMNALPPDPRTECCGLRSGNKIIRGTEAAIDEYPWLALIEYEKDGVIKALCNGALISGKYVLTPGHCVVGPILNVGTPKNIRLGEYDTVNDGRDCINIEGGGMDCTDPPVVIPIELTILHPQIELNSRKNDIALIRMRQNAPFTDFIQPICLPTVDVTASRSDEDRYLPLITAGWRTFNNGDHSTNNIQHIFVPFVNNTECAQAYSSLKQNITLWNKQLCSGGENNMKTCNAPIEGPLMYNDGRKYEIVGVENFAPRHRGVENIPKMYIKVYEYITWIHNAITP